LKRRDHTRSIIRRAPRARSPSIARTLRGCGSLGRSHTL
jgi:hypothetical protein